MDITNPIGDMFRNEDLFRMMKLSGEQIKEKSLRNIRRFGGNIEQPMRAKDETCKAVIQELYKQYLLPDRKLQT